MIGFLAGAALLLALTFLILLVPYWRRGRGRTAASRQQLNAAIYRDQMAELDRDLAAGSLAEADHRQAKEELQSRLLEDSAESERGPVKPAYPKRTLAVLAVLMPMAAAGLYLLLGNPEGLKPAIPQHQVTADEVERMVTGLAARLEKEPENLEGWVMLARSYRVMRRFPDAAKAYGRAGALVDNDPKLLAEYADALIAASGSFEGKPVELVGRALKLDPNNVQARWLSGTAFFERGRYAEAVAEWERLQKLLPPGSEDAQALAGSIEEARAKGSLKARPAAKASAPVAAAGGKQIAGRVDLAPALKANAAPTDTVMVVARIADGPRMPVAVLRARVSDLPLDFVLDDSLAMSPDNRISLAERVTVEARVSKSGQAVLQKGDLQSSPRTVKVGAGNLRLLVDQIHP
jgi:cytochrome c-type biogenesis protein CcmH